MRWTPILDALAMIGGEAMKARLARAMAARDVAFRGRTSQGLVIPGDPRMIVSTGKTRLGDPPPHKVRWEDGTLDRFLLLTPEWAAPEPPLAIEIDVGSLIETFGPIEAPSAPAAPTASAASRRRRWAGIDDAALIAEMRDMIRGDRAQSVTAAATELAPRASGNGTIESKAKRLQRKYVTQ